MEGIVEENGAVDPLAPSPDPQSPIASVQSVIQPNQQSVIQTAANIQPMLAGKGNVILVSKPNSVIQTTQGNLSGLQTLQVKTFCGGPPENSARRGVCIPGIEKQEHPYQFSPPLPGLLTVNVVDAASDDSFSEEESPKKRRDLLTRRPSYRKILNDLGGGEIAETKVEQISSEADSELSSHSIPYHTVLPGAAIQISGGKGNQGIHTLTMTNSTAGGAIVQYAQGQEFFVPVVAQSGNLGGSGGEDQDRKREMRLLKNREAARECRRKKKEYIKCLENRVAVLENQNKALIDELKSLKELYCQQKTE